jgi:hypothetical protein
MYNKNTPAVYCNQYRHAWHFHKHLMSNHNSAMILRLSKISPISNQQDFPNLQRSRELVEPTSNNGMDTCLQMHFLVRGNMLTVRVASVAGCCHGWQQKSLAISSLVSAAEKALFLDRAAGGSDDASSCPRLKSAPQPDTRRIFSRDSGADFIFSVGMDKTESN